MATEAITLDKDAFARLVTEENLRTTPSGGYMYAGKRGKNGWELYRTFDSWDGVPISTAVTADPAAGAQLATVTVPAGKKWLLLAARTSLVADANVANRIPVLVVREDGTNTDRQFGQASFITAGQTRPIVFYPGAPNALIAVDQVGALINIGSQGIELCAGAVFYIFLFSMQVGDDLDEMRYVYKEVDV